MASSLLPNAATSANADPTLSFSSSLSPWTRRFPSSAPLPRRRRRSLSVQSKVREIFMPALSSTMTEGKIVSWVKSEGDVLSKGESVVVVESDKADMDVETFYDGILAAIVVPAGETAPVGAPIGLLAETEDEIAEAKAKAKAAANSGSASPAPSAPKAEAAAAPAVTATPAPAIPQPPPAPGPAKPSGKVVATPFAKKLAKQHKVDINKLVGTGPYGRITPSDVEAAAGIKPSNPAFSVAEPAPVAAAAPPKPAAAAAAAPPPLPGSTVVPFTTMQAAVSKNMLESLTVPTFRVGFPVSTDALDALYEK
ncbi:hypothetical protein CRG98_019132, partial [Punica granatum]